MLEISSIAASGSDYFLSVLLKKCAEALSTPIYLIWRKSPDLGVIPKSAKDAIHKGGSRALPKN